MELVYHIDMKNEITKASTEITTTSGSITAGGGTYIDWSSGVPIPRSSTVIANNNIPKLISAVVSLPYEGDEITHPDGSTEIVFDPRYKGMTRLEVAVMRLSDRAARGDLDALKEILDRTLGKPKQSVESVNVNVGYEDYLQALADKENENNPAIQVIPIPQDDLDF